jgi:hypothetical protein
MSVTPVYRAGTTKRKRRVIERRRTRPEVEQLDRQICEVLEEDHPQSVRHIFYRMTDPRLPEPVEKSDRGYRHVQDRCVNSPREQSSVWSYHRHEQARLFHRDLSERR